MEIENFSNMRERNVLKNIVRRGKGLTNKIGPGVISGAADDDPSGIATYSQVGANYGFSYLWLSLYTFPLMAVVQEMCARIAVATGKGLARNISEHFPKWILYTITILLFIANTFNIGADLGAMSEAMTLLFPSIPSFVYLILIAVICLVCEIYLSYAYYSKYLKWLTFVLVSYIVAGVFINFDFFNIIKRTLIPSIVFDSNHLFIITAVLGTTISPYLFFWQTSQEVEEENLHKNSENQKLADFKEREMKAVRYDVWFGMFFSNLVTFFIIAVCADNLFRNGITNIESAAQAANALKPIAGHYASLLFSLGIIGTGFLAIPVLAGSSAYAIAESFRWKEGLYLKFKQARPFYFIIIVSVLFGLLQNFIGLSAFKALIYSAVLNGLIAPLIIITIVIIAKREDIMGNLKNSRLSSFVGLGVFAIMALCAGATFYYLIFN